MWNFKKSRRTSLRRMRKFQTRSTRAISDIENRRQNAEELVKSVKPYMVTNGEESFYNADESGFNLKMHSGRTLSAVRTKTIVTTSVFIHNDS